MSSPGGKSGSRKRPHEDGGDGGDGPGPGSRSARAQDVRRRQIQQASWGFREVLAECGLAEFADGSATEGRSDENGDGDDAIALSRAGAASSSSDLGCRLEPEVSPSALRSSIHALLSEMSRNEIDPDNRRVLKDMEDIVLGGGGDDDADEKGDGGENGNFSLRRMLLPLHRVRNRQNRHQFSQFSQFSQPESPDKKGEEGKSSRKIVVESSSLVKVLLRVDVLQPTLLTALMQKLPELASPSDDEGGSFGRNDDVPRLVFSNVRWLDHVVEPASLVDAFVECLTVLASASSSCAKTRGILLDAISTLPDVLNDANYLSIRDRGDGDDDDEGGDGGASSSSSNPVLSTLQLLRVEDPTLLIPCLDAIGSLPLTEDQMADATRDALEALANAEPWGLPALTGFLMNNCPAGGGGGGGMAREVIEEMRKLPLGSVSAAAGDDDGEGDGMDLDGGKGADRSASDSACLMIESLSRGFAHRSDLASTLLKCIRDTPHGGHHPPADVWLLACCASAPHNRPKVKSVLKSKASSGGFTSRLLRESLAGNGPALTGLFGALCDLADGLLRSSDGAGRELGGTLYGTLFDEFEEPMQRQEVVGSLVTHVGSGVGVKPGEVDAALRVFCGIADGRSGDSAARDGGATALRPFTPFLTSMLDHLHHMTASQVRRLFLLLFAVGGDDEGGGDGVRGAATGSMGGAVTDIVIRKHLALAPFAKKRIGIIGTVAYAVSRSSPLQEQQKIIDDENEMAETEATCLAGSAAVASSPIVKEIRDMIQYAYSHCKPSGLSSGAIDTTSTGNNVNTSSVGSAFSDGSAMAFMLDELCHAVRGGRLAAPIREWLDELFQGEFETYYVGDFEEESDVPQVTKGAVNMDRITPDQIPTSSRDLALLNGTSVNSFAPRGELRFNIAGSESIVYLKILPLLSSHNGFERELLPVQLCPMFRLMSTISDLRYGGKGLSEIDAMLECPLLLPTAASSGMDFEDLSSIQQWVVTSSYFFATCWVRQLINSFIYAAGDAAAPSSSGGSQAPAVGSFTSSSQGFNCDEVQKKIVSRLRALVDLEEELRFTTSKCFVFAPPGLDLLPAPKELFDDDYSNDNNEENRPNTNAPDKKKDMSKEEKKALAIAKRKAIKRAKDRVKSLVKSKQQRLKAKQKHEENLVYRSLAALRPLDPQVCVALGFEELSVVGNAATQGASQGLSQFQQVTSCGGPVTTMLLNLLRKALSDTLLEKKSVSFKARMEGNNLEEDADDDNPYMVKRQPPTANASTNFADIALASCEESAKKSFALLDSFLKGGVFASLYEHLAAVAELRCGQNRRNHDAETESQLVETARCVFSCIKSLMSSELLTRSATGKMFLASILKQIAEGDRADYGSDNKRRRTTTATMNKLMGYVMDNVNEIITGAYTGDLEFAMDGVECMQAIENCSKRLSDTAIEAKNDDGKDTLIFPAKLSEVADKLLRQNWPEDTKMNKGNIGKLLSLLVEHSPNRMETLSSLVNDVLQEVPHLDKGSGVAAFPTCSHHTFGSYYSTVLEYLWKELVNLFNSPLGKTKDPDAASKAMELMHQMIGLLQLLSGLTKENDSLAKKIVLLQQLKFGSRFIETFVLKAIPFFQVHFQHHEETILDMIRLLQRWSHQLYHIISHGKREKDANLAKEAPRAKKALEMFIHKVKAMLKKNRCLTAMWTKTLKAKDIDGTTLKAEKEAEKDEEEQDSENEGEDDAEDSEEDGDDASGDFADNSEDEYDTDED